jgi:hypothetical protein
VGWIRETNLPIFSLKALLIKNLRHEFGFVSSILIFSRLVAAEPAERTPCRTTTITRKTRAAHPARGRPLPRRPVHRAPPVRAHRSHRGHRVVEDRGAQSTNIKSAI